MNSEPIVSPNYPNVFNLSSLSTTFDNVCIYSLHASPESYIKLRFIEINFGAEDDYINVVYDNKNNGCYSNSFGNKNKVMK